MASGLQQLADRIARKYGIPTQVFRKLIQQESGWNPAAVSPVGAVGLTQLMPKTAAGLGVDPHDPVQNLEGGARYLRAQLDRFGSVKLALAAYNAGPGAVQQYGGVPPYAETQRYVRNILSGVNVGKASAVKMSPLSGTLPSAGPDLASVAFTNLSTHADPMEQLSNLTAAVHAAGGPQTIELDESAPATPTLSKVPRLRFEGESLAGVDQGFLHKVSLAVAAVGGSAVRVTDARRPKSASYGATNSNHKYGHALDAEVLIGGKWVPIGTALAPVAPRFGLRSGATFDWNGRPDVIHVDDAFNQGRR